MSRGAANNKLYSRCTHCTPLFFSRAYLSPSQRPALDAQDAWCSEYRSAVSIGDELTTLISRLRTASTANVVKPLRIRSQTNNNDMLLFVSMYRASMPRHASYKETCSVARGTTSLFFVAVAPHHDYCPPPPPASAPTTSLLDEHHGMG